MFVLVHHSLFDLWSTLVLVVVPVVEAVVSIDPAIFARRVQD
jgi:hypothetical protein